MSEVRRFRRGARPFDFTAGLPRPGRYPPDELDVPAAIEAIRFAPVEVGYGFNAVGRQVFRQVGDQNEIRRIITSDLFAIEGGTFVHAHPPYTQFPVGDPRHRSGSFSARDLVFMYENRVSVMIAVTRERTHHLRQRPEGFFLDPGQMRNAYAEIVAEEEASLREQAVGGIISVEEAQSYGRLADNTMARLSLFFDYWWEEAPKDASRP